MLATKNSTKRIDARSAAAEISAGSSCEPIGTSGRDAGTWPCNMVEGTDLEFMLKAPAERCGIRARAVRRGASA
jgi:hypothetical protein